MRLAALADRMNPQQLALELRKVGIQAASYMHQVGRGNSKAGKALDLGIQQLLLLGLHLRQLVRQMPKVDCLL